MKSKAHTNGNANQIGQLAHAKTPKSTSPSPPPGEQSGRPTSQPTGSPIHCIVPPSPLPQRGRICTYLPNRVRSRLSYRGVFIEHKQENPTNCRANYVPNLQRAMSRYLESSWTDRYVGRYVAIGDWGRGSRWQDEITRIKNNNKGTSQEEGNKKKQTPAKPFG